MNLTTGEALDSILTLYTAQLIYSAACSGTGDFDTAKAAHTAAYTAVKLAFGWEVTDMVMERAYRDYEASRATEPEFDADAVADDHRREAAELDALAA